MQYMVIFTPSGKFRGGNNPSDFEKLEHKEGEQTKALYQAGGARQVWALDTQARGGIILFEAKSPEDLQEMIDSLPLIKANYAAYQIYPLLPYPAFGKPI